MTCLSGTGPTGEGATDSEFFHQRFRNFLYVDFIGPRKTLQTPKPLPRLVAAGDSHQGGDHRDLVLEQYLAILPERIKPWVCAQKPETCEKLVTCWSNTRRCTRPEGELQGEAAGPCWGKVSRGGGVRTVLGPGAAVGKGVGGSRGLSARRRSRSPPRPSSDGLTRAGGGRGT